jgi:hypothetical protein
VELVGIELEALWRRERGAQRLAGAGSRNPERSEGPCKENLVELVGIELEAFWRRERGAQRRAGAGSRNPERSEGPQQANSEKTWWS